MMAELGFADTSTAEILPSYGAMRTGVGPTSTKADEHVSGGPPQVTRNDPAISCLHFTMNHLSSAVLLTVTTALRDSFA